MGCLSRKPSPEESGRLAALLAAEPNARLAVDDVLWAVLNSREFLFIKDLYEKEKLANDRLRLEKERLTKDALEHSKALERADQKVIGTIAEARDAQRRKFMFA